MKRLWDEFWDGMHDFFSGGFGVAMVFAFVCVVVIDLFTGPPISIGVDIPCLLCTAFIIIALRHKKS